MTDHGAAVDKPRLDRADVGWPRAGWPVVDQSKIDGPEVDGLEVDGPEVDGPKVDGPELDRPEVDGPEVDGPELDWVDGAPVSRRFGDPYFSAAGGLAETAHVFLAGNGLPGRFRDGFHIAELGFGTGLNLLAVWQAWERAGVAGRCQFTSFEAFPMTPADMARALSAFPELADKAALLVAALAHGPGPYALGPATLTLIRGDVRDTLPRWPGPAEAWFLDGFAPAKNPEMWGDDLMALVAARLSQGGTLATYTAAGHVRRALAAAGLEVARVPGYGRKRHMTLAKAPT